MNPRTDCPDVSRPLGIGVRQESAPVTALFRLFQVATTAVFLGRAWQHLRWDAPFRDLFWDEYWLGTLVVKLGWPSWQAYVTDPATDAFVQQLIRGFGWFYLLCALAAIGVLRFGRPARILLQVGAGALIFLAALYTKERFFFLGQFLEYTLQFSVPLFLVYLARGRPITPVFILLCKVAIAITFICHGLYAVGYYPRPESFQTMVITILRVDNATANQFLNLAGGLDFLFSVLLFIPWKRLDLVAACYLTFWGCMTTAARIWAFVYWEFLAHSLEQWLHESVFRLPHALVPLALVIILTRLLRREGGLETG